MYKCIKVQIDRQIGGRSQSFLELSSGQLLREKSNVV